MKSEFVTDISSCARCGKDHKYLVFRKFSESPIYIAPYIYDYWSTCPTTGEPILLKIVGLESNK